VDDVPRRKLSDSGIAICGVAVVFAHSHSPLPERMFVVVEHGDGRETIGFDGGPVPGRELGDIETRPIDPRPPAATPFRGCAVRRWAADDGSRRPGDA
jgi:hypothetical protein